jgi:signal transduction histidine kinase
MIVDGRSGYVVITCHNTGPPIAPELFSQLFKPFARSPNSAGLGLGLYIVSRIVKDHCGHMDVSSTIETGTTFTVRLPRGSPLKG